VGRSWFGVQSRQWRRVESTVTSIPSWQWQLGLALPEGGPGSERSLSRHPSWCGEVSISIAVGKRHQGWVTGVVLFLCWCRYCVNLNSSNFLVNVFGVNNEFSRCWCLPFMIFPISGCPYLVYMNGASKKNEPLCSLSSEKMYWVFLNIIFERCRSFDLL
jgi:hypothetical protein